MTAAPPALPAALHPLVRAFLDDPAALARTAGRFDTPLHLVFPQVFAENLAALGETARRSLPAFRICYAHKVNQSAAFVRAAERAGIAIDVASPRELGSALAAGFTPDRIEVTGPKGERFLRELPARGVTINVDNAWELGRVAELSRDGARTPVLVRVCGFEHTVPSRFGIPLDRFDRVFDLLAAAGGRIALLGFAFHLDSGALADRVRAVDACLALVERAHRHGHAPSVLDIGGGFRQVFTADADRFDDYVRTMRAALLGRGEPMTWGANTFGYQVDGGAVHGIPVFHKYANTVAATRMLDDLLTAPLDRHGGRSVAEVVTDNLLTLWLEPGKALVDHAGVTVARVEFTKELADGTVLVDLDLSRDTVTPADQEVMVDPVVRYADAAPARPGDSVGVYFAGRLCLERDMVTQHKVWLPRRPDPGDLVVFPNTAAYHMDLSAASASMHPVPPKVAVTRRGAEFHACRDADALLADRVEVP